MADLSIDDFDLENQVPVIVYKVAFFDIVFYIQKHIIDG